MQCPSLCRIVSFCISAFPETCSGALGKALCRALNRGVGRCRGVSRRCEGDHIAFVFGPVWSLGLFRFGQVVTVVQRPFGAGRKSRLSGSLLGTPLVFAAYAGSGIDSSSIALSPAVTDLPLAKLANVLRVVLAR